MKRVDIKGQELEQKTMNLPVNEVYKTDDLDMFKFTKFNRNILFTDEMLKQAKEGFISPIIVNEYMVVIDGQHRLEHAKKAGVPIEYIIKPGLGEHDIVRMNTTQRPWSLLNFIESYANQGSEQYVSLLNLINKKYAGTSVVIAVGRDTTGNYTGLNELVKSGNFEFVNFEQTLNFLKYYERFKEETKTPKKTKVALALYALYRIEGFDEDRLIRKVLQKKFDDDLRVKGYDLTEALKEFIDKYNDKLTQDSPSFIEYYVKNNGELIIDNPRKEWAQKKTAK
ncbi:ParB N-terminal domain-containing protein [Staphylococcus pettenkoferi]|uniref:ParB N-terminal domain-containing protein n=1 Tax=Staphylococcus pettenkoferi TaxID=170573 RepID=A0ABT4BNY6_9STAP|nr:ParB N-terminal domain-containing protein [Staphylococcus pettenkoferi]MCY1564145.1 ParB N-terminal domain-containing protein [Staphylococcus pettenkoferi]MCY1571330.1 ParB N-terminal domain-containing protein [Staphylococcus pettenkoferi]MCY1584293.1 ParB N-terminal domain-containing protein [Staphylococcus pettenkoferi]MCY1606693.1 ParB N-terminal domain-containing protein [Staphylococcus pettenkoferi]MDH9615663.1 ParB N-terminal domain-containing protein [Staphylococcus pettenkoferi]